MSDMQQYRCPECADTCMHQKGPPAPICHKCTERMVPTILKRPNKSLEAGGNHLAGTIIHAHLAGQEDAGVDPSHSNAQAYYRDCQGKPKPIILVTAGHSFQIGESGIVIQNLSNHDYNISFDFEKIPESVPLVFSMDEEWLYKWATCFGIRLYKDGAQFSMTWMQFEYTPIWEDECGDKDYGYVKCVGRSAPIMFHDPKLPDNDVNLQDTLTFVTEATDGQ